MNESLAKRFLAKTERGMQPFRKDSLGINQPIETSKTLLSLIGSRLCSRGIEYSTVPLGYPEEDETPTQEVVCIHLWTEPTRAGHVFYRAEKLVMIKNESSFLKR